MFGRKANLTRLHSSEELDLSQFERSHVTVDKKMGDLGLTIGNTEDGSGVIIVAMSEKSICLAAGIRPGQVLFKVNEHDVGTHAEAVALLDKAANGVCKLELSKLEADQELVDQILASPQKSVSSKNLFAAQ